MFQVKTMSTEDFSFAVELANTMNWNMSAVDFAFNVELEPKGCLVLLDESKRIGIATCISYGKVGWFGNLIVEESYRNQGAGTQLVKHALKYLQSTGVSTVGLYAYRDLVTFYSRLGFKRDIDFSVLKSGAISAPSYVNDATKITHKELPRITQFDSWCFGASRKKILEKIIGKEKNISYLATEENRIIGYITSKVYDETAEIGPLVSQKDHISTAVLLLKIVLSELEGKEGYMYLPKEERKLLEAAAEAGFRKQFNLARMFLGSVTATECVYIAESLERG